MEFRFFSERQFVPDILDKAQTWIRESVFGSVFGGVRQFDLLWTSNKRLFLFRNRCCFRLA
jgi:hypothetical protein